MSNSKIMNYSIHSFMIEELDLGGASLLVYAVIYSFTKGDKHCFYGSQGFLARAIGMSVSSVKRALDLLLEKKYIKRSVYEGHPAYVAIKESINRLIPQEEDIDPGYTPFEIASAKELEGDRSGSLYYYFPDEERPLYEEYYADKGTTLKMTPGQYKNLIRLVGKKKVSEYIRRLEDFLDESYTYTCHSPYRTIKRWIYKDMSV